MQAANRLTSRSKSAGQGNYGRNEDFCLMLIAATGAPPASTSSLRANGFARSASRWGGAKQSSVTPRKDSGLLRYARNDGQMELSRLATRHFDPSGKTVAEWEHRIIRIRASRVSARSAGTIHVSTIGWSISRRSPQQVRPFGRIVAEGSATNGTICTSL